MIIFLQRLRHNNDTTIGKMTIDEVPHYSFWTLEDQPQKDGIKIYGETRIPAGTYEVKLRTEGRIHEEYKKRFPEMHFGTLHLQNVPGFEFVLIHIGNTDDDTLGCILIGNDLSDDGFKLVHSTIAYKIFYPFVAQALLRGEKVFIKVMDEQ